MEEELEGGVAGGDGGVGVFDLLEALTDVTGEVKDNMMLEIEDILVIC